MFDWLRARLERQKHFTTTEAGSRVRYYVDPMGDKLVGKVTCWSSTGKRSLEVDLERLSARSFTRGDIWAVHDRDGVLVGDGPFAGKSPELLRFLARRMIGWA